MARLEGESAGEELMNIAANITLDDVNQDLLFCHGMISGFLVYCSLPLHIFVLAMLVVERKLLDRGDVFLFTLFMANLLCILLHSSTIPIVAITKTWLFGDVACRITGSIQLIFVDIRHYCLIALSVHRFCHVAFPFGYRRYQNKVIIVMFIFLSFNTLLVQLVYFFVSNTFIDVSWPTCDSAANERFRSSFLVAFIMYRTISIGSGIVPFILYVIMWRKAREIKSRTTIVSDRRHTDDSHSQPHDNAINRVIKNYLKHTNFKLYKEKKAFTRLIVVFTTSVVIVIISNFKKFGGAVTFGLTNSTTILLIHYGVTWIYLTFPYLDMLMLLSTEDKVKARKSFLKKLHGRLGLSNDDRSRMPWSQSATPRVVLN